MAKTSFKFVLIVLTVIIFITDGLGGTIFRVKRGFGGNSYGGGGYGNVGRFTGSSYSPDLSICSGIAGNLATASTQHNLASLYSSDLGNAFQVGYAAQAIVKARRTSAAAGAKFKGGHGRR